MIKYFYDGRDITGLGFTCGILLILVFCVVGGNSYTKWKCNNFEEVTGFEVKYISFDACYVKGSDGVFIRYDSKYKSIN